MANIAKVALSIPFSESFDYRVPENLMARVEVGYRVLVSVGNRLMTGCVVEMTDTSPYDILKDILDVVEDRPTYSDGMLQFTRWISEYYLVSWGEVLEAAIPGGLKPKIEKTLSVEIARLDEQPDAVSEWLCAMDGKSESLLKRDVEYTRYHRQFATWKKSGLIRFHYVISSGRVTPPRDIELRLAVNKDDFPRTRSGSKTDQVLQMLLEHDTVSLSGLKDSIVGCGPSIRQLTSKGIISQQSINLEPSESEKVVLSDRFLSLNDEQSQAFDAIREAISERRFHTFLLFGVTGSGKTEVYLHAVKETLDKGKTVLILIPEISLTHQVVSRFKDRFGDRIAVLHSGMAEKDRCGEWRKLKRGICDIAIGARSAIFSPLENIGLIVVDEEHDASYKQQESPFYNARDIAVKLGLEHNATVILGSATPSVETFNNADQKKYTLLTLSNRANQKPLPPITIISLKDEKRQSGVFYLSKPLVSKLKQNLENKKQALVFLNRRGYAAFLSCPECELPVLCENCSIALTWHKKERRLICHHCGFKQPYPKTCPSCGHDKLRLDGIGTERIERDLQLVFPSARFLRMDRDTVKRKGELEKNIDIINNHEVDFIIGTQLISKGHDFKHVGLVCVILADIGLNIPDFRSSERSFQLLSQVSGRAGRDESGHGMVLAQTYNPNHFAIVSAMKNDVRGFIEWEMDRRHALENPPVSKMILLRISDTKPGNVEVTARQMGELLIKRSSELGCQVMGPVESPILKINKRYYWQILLKANDMRMTKRFLWFLFWQQKEWRPVGATRVSIDVDPYHMV